MSLLEDLIFLGQPSLEDAQVGVGPAKEIEYEIYGQIVDLGELDKAPRKELQEQWGLFVEKTDKNVATGNIRVRAIDDERYVLTTKIKLAEGSEEEEVPSTEHMFTHFKKLADQGMRKMRYFFPVEGSDFIYEVDAFYNGLGQLVPWIKIDLELPEGVESINELPDLPFEMSDVRVIPPGKKNEEDLAFVRALFDEHFNLPNAFVDRHAPAEGEVSQEGLDEEAQDAEAVKSYLLETARRCDMAAKSLSYNQETSEGELKFELLEMAHKIARFYGHEEPL